MEVSEILSLMDLITLIIVFFSGGLGGAIMRYILDVRRAKYEYVIKLHREWWSPEFCQMRSKVYKIVEDFNTRHSGSGTEANFFLSHIEKGNLLQHPAGRAFSQIMFFFADLNACLEMKLIDAKLTYRLFGKAQYSFFQPLIVAVRKCRPNETRDIRWRWETKQLEEKFESIRQKMDD